MNRREFMARAAAGAVGMGLAAGCARNTAKTDRPPNFIVVLADDIGAGELGCYGHPSQRTPELDRMAREDVQFDTCYASPICHPSRVMLLTGQYGCRNGVYNFSGMRGGPAPDSPAEDIARGQFTFANALKANGYATALAGKWQLSGKQPDLIFECDFDEYCVWAMEGMLPPGTPHPGGREGNGRPARYWHPSILLNGRQMPTNPDDYGPNLHHEFVTDFMRRHREQPFVVYYSMCLTHGPHLPTPDQNPSPEERKGASQKNYPDTVEYLDKLMGRLDTALGELGLRENTIVFFTGDNGTGGAGKGQPTEQGARVPMIVQGPGIVKKRGLTPELTDLSDIFPTLLDFAGVPLPEGRPIDGRSLAPFLRGESDQTRDWIFSFIADRRILRTRRWLLEDNSPLHYGHLYDCGDRRDGKDYRDVTESQEPEVLEARARFDALLEKLPAPILSEEGGPTEPQEGAREARRALRREDRENTPPPAPAAESPFPEAPAGEKKRDLKLRPLRRLGIKGTSQKERKKQRAETDGL
ncbi:MAG: sulfatase-like hydrolase/transferase [Candidatus Hydrogenedentes bacterium]|nr:sulfatase-like hydrolase/transferase [Candidatus Hydrogenedentota bacterium]